MNNRIQTIRWIDYCPVPAAAELRLEVAPEQLTSTTEIRGRLMGPSCLYSTTVEISYPFRPVTTPPSETALTVRANLVEASLWDPSSPFLYRGRVELWQDGQECDRQLSSHGIRQITLSQRGLIWNGKRLKLNGRSQIPRDETEARRRHDEGVNLLVVPIEEASRLAPLADRVGLVLLVEIKRIDAELFTLLSSLESHACLLGWIAPLEMLRSVEGEALLRRKGKAYGGARYEGRSKGEPPTGIAFAVGPNSDALPGVALPYLALSEEKPELAGLMGMVAPC